MKILVIRNDRFGEFLLIIPALTALKRSFPGAKIALAVNPYVKELAGYVEYADEVIVWENNKYSLREVFEFSAKLKEKKFDLAIVFNPSKESHLISFLAGIPKRVGYDRKWGLFLTHKIKDNKHLAEKHEVEYNLELARLAGAEGLDTSLSLKSLPALDRNNYQGALALHPYASEQIKQWPWENFRILAKKLADELQIKVVIIGRREETSKKTDFSSLSPAVTDLTNQTSLVELAALLKQSKMLISGDSGPVHLASAVGTPVLALFRNDLPGKIARRWGPWGKNHIVIEKSNLADITVEEVIAGTMEILGR